MRKPSIIFEKMPKQKLINFCISKNILLNNGLLELFSKTENLSNTQIFLEKLKDSLKKKFITKELIISNKGKINKILMGFSIEDQKQFRTLLQELGLSILDKEEIKQEKIKKRNFNYGTSSVKVLSSNPTFGRKLEVKDFVNYFRGRYSEMKEVLEDNSNLEELTSINKLSIDRQKVSVIGIVYSKKLTNNGNFILEIEDLTGRIKVMISKDKEELFEKADNIALDSVLGFRGFGNKDILFVNEMIFPEGVLIERKKSPTEEIVLFIGDVHFGSKNFLEEDFLKFIDYLKEENSLDPEVKKIKYLFIVGDLITGVGNYPNQEKDLKTVNLEEQFQKMANLLKQIRKDIQIIISPGNHDCVRLMEPQPLLDETYAWPLYELENVTMIENPSLVNIGSFGDFEGFNILVYHGFSFPYYANNIPKLMVEKTMNSPEKIMKYLLLNRHLAPAHSSIQYFPLEKDPHFIKKIPDVFVAGHTHKSGVTHHNNILLVSSSSWEGMTPYQEKFGNKPDHCKVPMLNLKTRAVKILDFETVKETGEENEN